MTAIDLNALRTALSNNVTARLASDKAQSMTASNRKKLSDFADLASRNDAIATLLISASYDAMNINQNVYSVDKVADIVRSAATEKQNYLSVYCNALFNSILTLEKASVEVTRDVVASLC